MNVDAIIRHLRLKAFPIDTEEGRAAERYRLALWTILANFTGRLVGMLIMVLSVRWTIPYLGSERFGAWMTVTSFAAVLSFLDMGVGNALTNRVAHASISKEAGLLTKTVSGGLGLLAGFAIATAVILMGVASVLPWSTLLKLQSSELAEEVRATAMMFGILFAVSILANGVARIFHGLQRGFEAYLAGILGSLLGLVALAFAVRAHAGLPILLLSTMAGSLAGNFALWGVLWARGYFSFHGSIRAICAEAPSLMHTGSLFLLLQIGTMVGWGADSLIVASANGAASVAAFSVTQRLMQFVSQPIGIVNAPLWAAYAAAAAQQDHAFIRKTFVHSLKLSFWLAAAGASALVLFGQEIINLWTKAEAVPTLALLSVTGLLLVLKTTGDALAMLLNGLGIVRQQVWIVLTFVAMALPLKLWWGHWHGASGVVSAGIVAYVISTVLGYGLVFRKDIAERMA